MIKEGYKPTWKNKKLYFMYFPNAAVVFGITLLLIGSTIIIAPVYTSMASPIDSRAIVWDVTLNFNESGGMYDYVVFGEAPDANDGAPADSYDQPKPPAPMLPYVRAWFDDGLSPPYNQMSKDYREYNNSNYKEWNLTIRWEPDDASNTDVNVTWDSDEFNDSEYDIVILYDIDNNVEVDMILNSYYEFLCPAYVPQDFTINCSVSENQPPVAVNDTATTPEDTTVVIDVLDNDYDLDGAIDPTKVTIVDDVSHGNTSVNGTTGEVTYTPDPDYHGSDNFTYTVDDDDGATSNEATVSITVTDVNDPPVFSSETPTNGTTDVSISTPSLSVTIEDPDGDSYNWSIQTSPNIGNSFGNGTNSSIISCGISGLAYSTPYTWFVSVSDGKDWTNESYSFTTKAKSGGGGSGSGAENQNPVADADGPYSGFIDEEITFDGSGSTDEDGSIANYTWDFGDTTTGYGINPTHAYGTPGEYTVILTVTDDEEATDTNETTVVISQPNRIPSIPHVDGPQEGTRNTEYTYTAVSTDEDNDTIQYHFEWGDGTTNTTAFLPNGTATIQTHTWTAAGKYTISVQAHDNQTPSDITRYTVLIDTRIVDDIGYITDDDANGTYDTFHDTDLETGLGQDEEGKYYIDSDGDGEWNYVYDPETEELTEYEAEPTPLEEEDYTGIILLGLLIIIIIIIFVYMVMKKKKPELPKKNKK